MLTYHVYGITSILALGGFLAGMEASSLSSFVVSESFQRYYGAPVPGEEYLILSSNGMGAIVGCVVCGALCDALGCVRSFQMLTVFWFIGTVLACASKFVVLMVVGRVFKGVALGFVSVLVPVYVAETIPASRKGSSLSAVQLCSSMGSLSMFSMSYIFQKYFKHESAFKAAWASEAFPALILVACSFFLPESPKWLAFHSNWADAARNLRRIQYYHERKFHRAKEITEDEAITDKETVIQNYTASDRISYCSFGELFDKSHWRHTVVGMCVQTMVQLSGVGAFLNLFTHVCALCGIAPHIAILVCCGQLVISVLFACFPIIFLDSSRRKDSLIFGLLILSASYFSIFLISLIHGMPSSTQSDQSIFNWVLEEKSASAMLALCLFIAATYATFICSVSWLYTGEIFHGSSRSKGVAICLSASWVTNTGMESLLSFGIEKISFWMILILSFICLTSSFVLSTFPETRSLNDVKVEKLFTNIKRKQNELPSKLEKSENSKINTDQFSAKKEVVRKTTTLESKDVVHEEKTTVSEGVNSFVDSLATKLEEHSDHRRNITSDSGYASNEIQNFLNIYTASEEEKKVFSSPEEAMNDNPLQMNEQGARTNYSSSLASSKKSRGTLNSNGWFRSELQSSLETQLHSKQNALALESASSCINHQHSGNSFFHGNSEGSPHKGGISYEPTDFLRSDSTSPGKKHQVPNLDFAPNRMKLKGGTFIKPLNYEL